MLRLKHLVCARWTGKSAAWPELAAIADGMRDAGRGVIEVGSDMEDGEWEILRDMAARAQRPMSVLVLQITGAPDRWRDTLAWITKANSDGLKLSGQVGTRPIGLLMGLEATVHPFVRHAAFAEVAGLPLPEKVARLRNDTELRRRLLAERQWQPGAPWVQPRTTAVGEDFHQWMDFVMTRSVALLGVAHARCLEAMVRHACLSKFDSARADVVITAQALPAQSFEQKRKPGRQPAARARLRAGRGDGSGAESGISGH